MSKVIDLTGQRFGELQVIERAGSNKNGKALWLCKCDCSKDKIIIGSALVSGNTRTCGDPIHKSENWETRRINLTGNVYGELEVIGFDKIKDQESYWKCKCSCGKIVSIRNGSLQGGNTKTCGHSKIKDCGVAATNDLYYHYRKSSEKRNLKFELNLEEFKNIIFDNCFYCGIEPNKSTLIKTANGNIVYNGIDRKNNYDGYNIDNCVSCCFTCNQAKLNMPLDNFLKHVDLIYLYKHKMINVIDEYNYPINKEYNKLITKIYKHFIRQSKRRKVLFDLDINNFQKILEKNCIYCGRTGENKYNTGEKRYKGLENLLFMGIDRIDSSIGYVENNIIPCCGICNKMKMRMNQQDFYSWIDHVYNHIHGLDKEKNGDG